MHGAPGRTGAREAQGAPALESHRRSGRTRCRRQVADSGRWATAAGGCPRQVGCRGRSAAAAGRRPSGGRPAGESVQLPVGGWAHGGAGPPARVGAHCAGDLVPRRPRWVCGRGRRGGAGEAGRAARGDQRLIEPCTVSLAGDCTLQFDWAAEREKENSVCSSRRREKRDSSPQRCGMQKTVKKKRLSVFFCWYCIYCFSTSASLYSIPCSKRSGGDVHFARSAPTTPDAMHGWGEQVEDYRSVGEAADRVGGCWLCGGGASSVA